MSDDPKPLADFITEQGIAMTAKPADANPNMIDPSPGMSHWLCILACDGRTMTLPYSMGAAHQGEPEIAGVLSCLALDGSGVVNGETFEDWAAEYGYDTDSRKAEATYKTIKAQAKELCALLGTDAFEALASGEVETD